MSELTQDTRTNQELFTQWRKLEEIRRSLVRTGSLNGDASPDKIISTLRSIIPPDLFPANKD